MSKVKGQRSNIQKGFSIMEVIISAFVLSVGIMGTVGLISSSIRHSIDSRDHIVASSLAQEGIEIIRNLRDNCWLNCPIGTEFWNFSSNSNCRVDHDINLSNLTGNIECGVAYSKRLQYNENPSASFYEHTGVAADNTKFQRKITISNYPTAADTNKKIQSIVTWGRADDNFPATCDVANKCVMVEDILMDWKK